MKRTRKNLVDVIESVSEQIQILALNIAVAAAKMSYNKKISTDVNSKLSKLVNQATLAVKNMSHILRAAKSERPKVDVFSEGSNMKIDSEMVEDIESSLKTILNDSQKIMDMLNEVKQKSV
ncbi:MAG: hypothetical protein GY839_09785 [candidate division Zixibacteria bacterium]|nr:hypothetical protein [candidate division Zixibacteria bacterium]